MRFMLLLLFALLVSSSASAQAIGSCAPSDVGSPSCPYQWAGVTSVAFTGDGNGLGLVGMTTQCRADFGPGARMCSSLEVLKSDSLNFGSIPATGCWIRPVIAHGAAKETDISGVAEDGGRGISCRGWQAASSGIDGLVLTSGGGLWAYTFNCAVARPVACCKPIAVGEPQASMMLPTGVGMLAMWSMMRGGA